MRFSHEGIQFHITHRSGTRPPFVGLHGMGGDRQQIVGLFGEIDDLDLYAIDQRGHGDTEAIVDYADANFHTLSEDVLAFLNHRQFDHCHLGGISMGAGVALACAVKEPNRFDRLVLVRPAWLADSVPKSLEIYLNIADHLDRYGAEEGEIQFQFTPDFGAAACLNMNAAQSLLGQFTRPQAADNADLLRGLVRSAPLRSLDELQRITAPVLLVGSDHDPTHPWAYCEVLKAHLPNAKLVQVTSAYKNRVNHNREIRAVVRDFLGGRKDE